MILRIAVYEDDQHTRHGECFALLESEDAFCACCGFENPDFSKREFCQMNGSFYLRVRWLVCHLNFHKAAEALVEEKLIKKMPYCSICGIRLLD